MIVLVVVVVLLAVLGVALLLRAGTRLASGRAGRPGAATPDDRSAARRRREAFRERPRPSLPPLPPGHRPPAGLGPLSPSERFLTTEAARGVRELQHFLFERPA